MLRLFTALDFPPRTRQRLAALAGGVPGARWSEPENLHLTLRFIGEVREDEAQDIDAELAQILQPAFELTLEGVGVFGSSRSPRLLWAGLERCEALLHLQAKIESAIVRAGQPPEERRFSPHVTLARLIGARGERIGRFIAERGLFRDGPIPIDHFTLYRSHLGKGMAVYEPLREYPLG